MGFNDQFTLEPRKRSRNTVNGVPVDDLDGHLPPPIPCGECGFPVWLLDAPDTVDKDGRKAPTLLIGEYAVTIPGCPILSCRHPYHLKDHRPLCRPDRPVPLFPRGLIVRPPR